MKEDELPYAEPQAAPRKVRPVKKKQPEQPPSLEPEAANDTQLEATAGPAPLRMNLLVRLFFGCLVVGIAVTTLALFEHPVLRKVGLLGPVLATLAYPVLGILLGIASRPATRERFADNCYYLGFIFTQASLLFAFLPATLFNRPLTSQDVLGFFGMAIGAALLGLIARTILVQMGSSLPEADDALHKEVEEVARQVAAKGQVIIAEFQTIASAAAGMTSSMDTNLKAIDTSLGRFDEVLRRELTSFESGSVVVSSAMNGAATAVENHQKAFGEHVREAADALTELRGNLDQRSEEALKALQEAAASISSGAQALGELSGVTDDVRGLEAKVVRIGELVDGVTDLSSHMADNIRGTADEISHSLQVVTGDAAQKISSAAERSSAELETSTRKVAADLETRSRSFETDLASTTEMLVAALQEFRSELSRLNSEREAVNVA